MQGDTENLAVPATRRNTVTAERAPDRHIIERVTTWMAVSSVGGLGLLAVLYRVETRAAIGSVGLLLLLTVLGLVGLGAGALITRLWAQPIFDRQLRSLAAVAEAVAAGDLSQSPDAEGIGGEMGRLVRAMAQMTAEQTRRRASPSTSQRGPMRSHAPPPSPPRPRRNYRGRPSRWPRPSG